MLMSRKLPLQESVVVLVFFFVFFLFYHQVGLNGAPETNVPLDVVNKTTPTGLTREEWIDISTKIQIDGNFEDDSAIKRLCSARTWHEDRVIHCKDIRGGIGNIRNELLACFRFAIEAGAGIVIPGMIKRSDTDLSEIDDGELLGLDYLFDEELFKSRISASCPQLKLYENKDELGYPVRDLPKVNPEGFGIPVSYKKTMLYPDMWLPGFEKWFTSFGDTNGVTTVAEFFASLAYYPVCRDGNHFASTFGRILEFRPDVRRLAASAIYEMSKRFDLDIDPTVGVASGKYFGAHLRTSEDATRLGWINYDTQKDRYLNICEGAGLSTIFVASGNIPDVKRFASAASPRNVVTKFDLLPEDDAAYLRNMTWDQQALVDYEILLKSSMFAGMTDSSFSWNIATRRRVLSDTILCSHWPVSVPEDVASIDSLSVVIGDREVHPDFSVGIWP